MGFELSADYVARIKSRLNEARVGEALDGAADPLTSAPSTIARTKAKCGEQSTPCQKARVRCEPQSPEEFTKGIIDAYKLTHEGFSVDTMLADAALNSEFLDVCKKNGLMGDATDWNRALLRIRKSGALPRLTSRAKNFTAKEMDAYSFASEVALQQLSVAYNATLDGILCDPKLAAEFDERARSFSPGYSSFQYRWAALFLRKRAKDVRREAANHCQEWVRRSLPRSKPLAGYDWNKFDRPGVYLLTSADRLPLYIGESQVSLGKRIDQIGTIPSWQELELHLRHRFPWITNHPSSRLY